VPAGSDPSSGRKAKLKVAPPASLRKLRRERWEFDIGRWWRISFQAKMNRLSGVRMVAILSSLLKSLTWAIGNG